jgi:hypothetical protein
MTASGVIRQPHCPKLISLLIIFIFPRKEHLLAEWSTSVLLGWPSCADQRPLAPTAVIRQSKVMEHRAPSASFVNDLCTSQVVEDRTSKRPSGSLNFRTQTGLRRGEAKFVRSLGTGGPLSQNLGWRGTGCEARRAHPCGVGVSAQESEGPWGQNSSARSRAVMSPQKL